MTNETATTNQNDTQLRPICFMVMPFGKKASNAEKGPATIDFDALWDKALFPLIEEELHYNAVRADQDLGALIIKEMIERLTYADLVIADVTIPNGNVYYEIGVRHAVKKTGCVMIAADWTKSLFDVDQMRQVRYPLPEGNITEETAQSIKIALREPIRKLIDGISPIYDCIPGYPSNIDFSRTNVFQKQVNQLSIFSAETRAIRLMPAAQRKIAIEPLVEKYKTITATLPIIALEIIHLLRNNASWQSTLAFIDTLPDTIRNTPYLKEQYALAQSKNGDHFAAIAALQELIKISGDSSEREGLIGGRYKKLYNTTGDATYLNKAIAAYDRGMRLDLNDYYPSCNLPRLLRTRSRAGDEEKAQAAATVALLACERKRAIDPTDEWLMPTLLAAAFDAGDVTTANKLYEEMQDTGVQPFHLDSVTADLKLAINLTKDEQIAAQLSELLDNMQQLSA